MDRFSGKPSLPELLADPILHLMMRADGCDMSQLTALIKNKPGGAALISTARVPDATIEPLARARPSRVVFGLRIDDAETRRQR